MLPLMDKNRAYSYGRLKEKGAGQYFGTSSSFFFSFQRNLQFLLPGEKGSLRTRLVRKLTESTVRKWASLYTNVLPGSTGSHFY